MKSYWIRPESGKTALELREAPVPDPGPGSGTGASRSSRAVVPDSGRIQYDFISLPPVQLR